MPEILIINSAEPGITEFTKPLAEIAKAAGFAPVVTDYSKCDKTDFSEYAGVIISGSPQGDDIVEHHKPYFKWIASFEKPVFGICAGHHLTGSLFGAELLRSEEPESGDFSVIILQDDPLFKNLPVIFKVRQMHNDSITVPESFKLLATAASCKNQIMKHKNKPLYTSQFHPEYYNHDLLNNFLELCK
ncbi:MAG: type 1 glutamine amidotransferase [Prolixibacteraceae bacterium]